MNYERWWYYERNGVVEDDHIPTQEEARRAIPPAPKFSVEYPARSERERFTDSVDGMIRMARTAIAQGDAVFCSVTVDPKTGKQAHQFISGQGEEVRKKIGYKK